ncbi:MAG: DNA translocase FtsK 4TM domain-containing protein, partial [Planctomycetia bacterium]|nr:DNA translocase FtsK 4TM domain-containing protein [Planctomycetia bacterium]
MLETLKRRQGLLALTLLALSVLLALALLSYDPADAPTSLVYPPGAETQNACGPVGAFVARALLAALGVGAYALALSGIVLSVVWLKGLSIEQPLMRLFGWLLMLVGLTTVAAMLGFDWGSYPAIGPGGYLG